MTKHEIELIRLALEEDVGSGDVTVEHFTDADRFSEGYIIAREQAVIAGTEVAQEVLRQIDPKIESTILQPDGSEVEPGTKVFFFSGPTGKLLTAERTMLNFLQRLSGVATITRKYREALGDLPVKLLDTRKTTPGFRSLEKAAVRAGGGTNHRAGLYDQVMVKDNHLASSGKIVDLQHSIDRAKSKNLQVEIEVDTLDQLDEVLKLHGVDMILLDNMSLVSLREAVRRNAGKCSLEASGGITLQTLRAVAETGVNAISVGALTHSARAVDLAMDFSPLGAIR